MRTSFTSLWFILCTFASVHGVTIRKSLVPESFLKVDVINLQMLNMSCPQTVMAEKWDCLARVAGVDVELFISLREDARFCPGKRGWARWKCIAKLATTKFKKNFGGVHKKISSLAKKLKSKSKPLVKKIREKAAGLVGKLKKKVSKKDTGKVANTVKKQAGKAGKRSKLKNMVKAGAIGAAAKGKHGPIGAAAKGRFSKKGVYGVKGSKLKGKGLANMLKAGKGLSKSSDLSATSTNPYVNNMSKTFSVNNSPYVTGPSSFGQ